MREIQAQSPNLTQYERIYGDGFRIFYRVQDHSHELGFFNLGYLLIKPMLSIKRLKEDKKARQERRDENFSESELNLVHTIRNDTCEAVGMAEDKKSYHARVVTSEFAIFLVERAHNSFSGKSRESLKRSAEFALRYGAWQTWMIDGLTIDEEWIEKMSGKMDNKFAFYREMEAFVTLSENLPRVISKI